MDFLMALYAQSNKFKQQLIAEVVIGEMVNVIDLIDAAALANITGALALQPAFLAPLGRIQMGVVIFPKRFLLLFAVPLRDLLALFGFIAPLILRPMPGHLIHQQKPIEAVNRIAPESAANQFAAVEALLAQLENTVGRFQPAKFRIRVLAFLLKPLRETLILKRLVAPLMNFGFHLSPNLFSAKNQRHGSYPLAFPCSQNFDHASKNCRNVNLSAGFV
jgi:hypothetical protein